LNGATFNNQSGATFTIENDESISSGGPIGTINNAGTFTKTTATGDTTIDAVFNNTGAMTVSDGTVTLEEGGSSTGTFTAAAAGTLEFSGGVHTLQAPSSVGGAGTVLISAGEVDVLCAAGGYAVTGTTTITTSANGSGVANFLTTSSSATLNVFNNATL